MSVGRDLIDLAGSFLESFLEGSTGVHIAVLDASGAVLMLNQALVDLLKVEEPAGIQGRHVREVLTEADARRLAVFLKEPPDGRVLLNFVDSEQAPQTLQCAIGRLNDGLVILGERILGRTEALQRELLELNNTLTVLSRENRRKSRELAAANRKLEETLDELNRSFWHLRKIQEVLPICMECGKVKTGDANWESVADYLRQHSLFLSHCYCPECAAAMLDAWNLEKST